MGFKFKFLFLLLLALPTLSAAQDRFVVSDIRLEGQQRISASQVFGLINISVGDEVGPAETSAMIRDIYASDDFENVEILRDGNVLVIRVDERPTISQITLEGNKLITDEAMYENMEGVGIVVGQTYRPSTVTLLELGLQDVYVGQGRYNSSVSIDVEEQTRNRVALTINVDEGKASKIVHMNIVGNTAYSEEDLLDLFELRTTHFWSMFSKDNQYSREKITGDLERLTSYYMDRGYVNFDITSTQVSVSPDRKQVYITINIDEGEIYTVDSVELAGDLVELGSTFNQLTFLRQGDTFSQQLVTTSSEFMVDLLNRAGYFFAEVEGIPTINEDDLTVDITFLVEPGNRTYVNRINFYGNTDTADEVLRRELRQMEGAPASTAALEASKLRLQQLRFLNEIDYEVTEVPGVSDQIDVDFSVEEQLSGSIGGSIGYAQVQGLVLSAELQQENFLGTGKRVGIGVNNSRFATNYNFNYYDPYYTIDGVSRGFSLSYSESDYARLNLVSYSANRLTAAVNYGYVVSETQQLSFNFGVDITELETGSTAVQEIKTSPLLVPGIDSYIVTPNRLVEYTDPDTGEVFPVADAVLGSINDLPDSAFNESVGFVDRFGNKFTNYSTTISWRESTLNRGLFPTAGHSEDISLQFTLPGSDLEFYKLRFVHDFYFPLAAEWIIHTRGQLGYGDGYGEIDELPFFQNFYAGGLGSVRGFEDNTLGPRSTYAEQYFTEEFTRLRRDADGNIMYDSNGVAQEDANSPLAYSLIPLTDEEGNLILENGLPVLENRLRRRSINRGRIPQPFGGNIQALGTLELIFPLYFIEDRSSVRSSFFIDAGNVFSSYCTERQELLNNCNGFDPSEFRYSAGMSVNWLSGFGLMTFSVAKAFNASEIDETEVFQFTIGNTF